MSTYKQIFPTIAELSALRDKRVSLGYGDTGSYSSIKILEEKNQFNMVVANVLYRLGRKFEPKEWHFSSNGKLLKVLSPKVLGRRYRVIVPL